MTDPDLLQEIMMSDTIQVLHQLSKVLPTNVLDPVELKAALGLTVMPLIRAMDGGRIHFDTQKDEAMLTGLLALVLDYLLDGNLKNSFKQASVN